MRPDSMSFRLLQWYGVHLKHRGQWRVHAALRSFLGPPADRDFPVERHGNRWVLNPCDYPQTELFWLGESDRWDLYHVLRRLRPGAVILDVGANFGYYSVTLASALQGDCEVYAFEPAPETFARLCHHIALNRLKCIHPHQIGLSDSPGFASLQPRQGNSGATFLVPGGEVEISTLDRFVEERGFQRLDFVKIDVEGFEERVLRGGVNTLARFHPLILIEIQPSTFERAGTSAVKVAELLIDHGYVVMQAKRRTLVPLEVRYEPCWLVNALCLPPGVA
jgi:FkbM family methyltransferase